MQTVEITTESLRNFRLIDNEIEMLGRKLDNARLALSRVSKKNIWAQGYWQQVIDRLLTQWRRLPILHDADAHTTVTPPYAICYNWWEKSIEMTGPTPGERWMKQIFQNSNLDESWNRELARRLQGIQLMG